MDTIGSISLVFDDVKTGTMGKPIKGEISCSLEVPSLEDEDSSIMSNLLGIETITEVHIRENFFGMIENLNLLTNYETELEFDGKLHEGRVKKEKFEENELLVGMYGTLHKDRISSLGFILWTPNKVINKK